MRGYRNPHFRTSSSTLWRAIRLAMERQSQHTSPQCVFILLGCRMPEKGSCHLEIHLEEYDLYFFSERKKTPRICFSFNGRGICKRKKNNNWGIGYLISPLSHVPSICLVLSKWILGMKKEVSGISLEWGKAACVRKTIWSWRYGQDSGCTPRISLLKISLP